MPNTCKGEHKKNKVVLKSIKERKTIWQFYYFIPLVEKQIPIEYQMEFTTWEDKNSKAYTK